jgi:hypothetical protein
VALAKEATWDDEKTEKVKTHEDDEFSGGKLSKNGANWSKNERKRSKNERKRSILREDDDDEATMRGDG